ncbi:TIGR02453 family protein [Shimia gijangensis]|uniref:TIGR02453 family protein n=1 Tax=Shimia gijangensis TaxID=1470563 RepID=A0A1M6DUL3_9RHOB|nr:TIGR02453 family protein [Shimia gijangensis]SHI76881.1 TIGR02453 family protein [Shimia gijangensis]
MSDDFADLVPQARAFLTELSANNNRDWFLTNKKRYEIALKHPALALLDVISADLEKMVGAPVSTKLFRPHRDVRFSKDKTPYHTHLHMLWTAGGIGWFLGIAPGYVSVGAGVFGFDKNALIRWRDTVAGADGQAIANMISALTDKGTRLDPPELKRVPAPYDKTHPRGDLLRRKGLALWFDLEDRTIEKGGLTACIRTAFSELLPVQVALAPLE